MNMLPAQTELARRAETVKRRVHETLGDQPAREFRASHAYQNYTAACGEVFWAAKTGELDENLLHLLEVAAEKVLETWKNQKG